MAGSFDRVRVLIVEDNAHMSTILRTMLQGFGVRSIHEVRSGEAALENLNSINPDIIMVDMLLEEMSGLEFCQHVRTDENSGSKYLPIIMVSGHTAKIRVFEAINAGVNEFLAKPVSPTDLFERLVAVIERPRRFVNVPDYFGPDRRRQIDASYRGPFRRATDHDQDDHDYEAIA